MYQLGLPMLNAAPEAVRQVGRRQLILRRVAEKVAVSDSEFRQALFADSYA